MLRALEGIAEQTVGMQLHEPSAFLDVGFASGRVSGEQGVDNEDFDAVFGEDVEQRNPVNTGGLNGDGADAAANQPLSHAQQVGGPKAELLDGSGIAIGRYRDKVTFAAYVNSARIGMDDGQARIVREHLLFQGPELLSIEPAAGYTLVAGHLGLRHEKLSLLLSGPRLGSVDEKLHTLQRGRAWPFARLGRPPINAS